MREELEREREEEKRARLEEEERKREAEERQREEAEKRKRDKEEIQRRLREKKRLEEEEQNKAATKLQAGWKGKQARKEVNGKRGQREEAERQRRELAAKEEARKAREKNRDPKLDALRLEVQEQRRLRTRRMDELARLRLLVALGTDKQRCHRCDLGVVNLQTLTHALKRICGAIDARVRTPVFDEEASREAGLEIL